MRELTVIARLLPVFLCGWLGVTAPAAEAQQLKSLRVYAGFLSQQPESLPLRLPVLTLSPKYDRDTTSYTASLPYSVTGTSLVAEASFTSKFIGVEGKTADGTKLDFSSWSYKPRFGGAGAVISFEGLEVGETTIRIAVKGIRRSPKIYSVVVNRAATASDSAILTRIELSPVKKRSRAYKLTPEFETATTRYAVNVPAALTSLRVNTATEHAGSVVEVGGEAADGQPLVLDGSQLSGLAIGANTLEIAVTSEDGAAKSVYTVAITRPVPDDDATLHEFQLSEGPPSPGFFASAMAGKLPRGDVTPSPAFDPSVTSYTIAVAQSDLTLRCRAARRSGITLSGRSSAGATLSVGNKTYLKDVSAGKNEGTFLSSTLSGLSSGENVIEIVVTAEDETARSYTVIVKRSGSQ
jgi:hypothetical protein